TTRGATPRRRRGRSSGRRGTRVCARRCKIATVRSATGRPECTERRSGTPRGGWSTEAPYLELLRPGRARRIEEGRLDGRAHINDRQHVPVAGAMHQHVEARGREGRVALDVIKLVVAADIALEVGLAVVHPLNRVVALIVVVARPEHQLGDLLRRDTVA